MVTGSRRRVSTAEDRLLLRKPLAEPNRAARRLSGDQELCPQVVELLSREKSIFRDEPGDPCPGQREGGWRLHEHAPRSDRSMQDANQRLEAEDVRAGGINGDVAGGQAGGDGNRCHVLDVHGLEAVAAVAGDGEHGKTYSRSTDAGTRWDWRC